MKFETPRLSSGSAYQLSVLDHKSVPLGRKMLAVSQAMVANNDRGRSWRSEPAALLAQNCGDDAGICHIFPVLVDAGGFHNRYFGATHMRASPYPRPA